MSRREVLRTHYIGVIKRLATWAGVSSILAMSLVAGPANAVGAQITDRSTTLGSSALSASTTYTFTFKPATTFLIKAIKFETCTSPLETTTCSTVTGASMSTGSGFSTSSPTTAPFTSNWATATGSAAPSANAYWIHYATGDTLTAGNSYSVRLTSIVNPSTANLQFYTRITTYSDDAAGAPASVEKDFGAMAVSTARQIDVSANVQESLVFCVGTSGTGCSGGGLTGTSVTLGTGTDNVLSASTPSGGQSLMAADTNATTGYVISYLANNLSSTNDTITAAGAGAGTGTAFSAGTALFGINLSSANTYTGTTSGGISGSGSAQAINANYTNNDKVAFVPATTTTLANSNSLPTVSNLYKVSYIAQAGNTTKPGAFSTTFTFVCTGTF
jgi:hypothetical protein